VEGLKVAKGDISLVMDADLSHPPKMIIPLIKAVLEEKCDCAVGSRLVDGGSIENWPWHRRIISYGALLMSRPMTGIKDSMSGFFAVRMDKMRPELLDPVGYKILLEILVKLRPLRVKEIPYNFRNRELGESKLGMKQHFDYIVHLGKLYRHTILSRPETTIVDSPADRKA
jgi:dolichol-phosphate mannosyltransferase